MRALLRWKHPQLRKIAPGNFISLPQAGLRRRGSLGSGLLLLVAVCHAVERGETWDKHGAPTL